MKHIKKSVIYLSLIGFMSINFIASYSSSSSEDGSLSLDNLKALQASATEMTCDQTNETLCTITITKPDGTVIEGRSKGYLVQSN